MEAIQACIRNALDREPIGKRRLAGIIGDSPSRYSKSPALWNAAFRVLDVNAIYLPLDVEESRLPELIQALKRSDRVIGVNVTIPYKVKIMAYLDSLDEEAKKIGAVNTIARTEDGRLVGYNTDGKGCLESITRPQPGEERPLAKSLKGMDVLLIGAGGAARAVAFTLAPALANGKLLICNRTPGPARSLAEEIEKAGGHARALKEDEVRNWAPRVNLIINGSTKGQGGMRKSADGRVTGLEPYSALAPASPATLPASEYGKPEFYRNWLSASLADIEANNRASWSLALTIPLHVGFYDMIYFPAETVFLRHGRLSGHRTLNGQGMIVAQAAEAFFRCLCSGYLRKIGIHNQETYQLLSKVMHEAW